MRPLDDLPVEEVYRDWALNECDDSPCFRAWALGVADDPEVVALIETLAPGKRQPNLVFASARWHGAEPGPYDALRTVLLEQWDLVSGTASTRATQTNEVGRCATLLLILAQLRGPLALLEVGCSAGLCLYPDRYSYRYTGDSGAVHLDPSDGPSTVVLECELRGAATLPSEVPEVAWRGGIDLNPLDVRDDDAVRWLETLVWPEHEQRRSRLVAAVELARADPPALVRGHLLDQLPMLLEEVPADATLVVFHSAVLAYLSPGDRVRFTEMMAGVRGHWVSNEGPGVLPGLAATASSEAPAGSSVGSAPFLLALDGRAVGWTHGHGQALWGL